MNEKYLSHQKRYVIGVSGGCDSMALLDMMVKKNYIVAIAHVNYNLREDTDEDYKVVHDYALQHNIPFYYKVFTKEDYQQGNFQAVARQMRYNFYHEVLDQGYDAVLLAHHLDDELETIYMYLERGSQTNYLGIKPITTIQQMTIIRPLLDTKKQALRDYCLQNHIAFHDDYTNFQTHFKRDQVRNLVLNTYTDKQKEALLLKAKAYNLNKQHIQDQLKPLLEKYHAQNKINYHEVPEALYSDFLFALLAEKIPVEKLSGHLIHEIIHQMTSTKPNITLQLPLHQQFIKAYDNITVTTLPSSEGYAYTITSLKEQDYDDFSIRQKGEMNDGIYVTEADFPLTIRSILPGDVIKTSGGQKKVARLFINNKIPSHERAHYPIVVRNDGQIILIPGIAKRYEYLSTNPNLFVIK